MTTTNAIDAIYGRAASLGRDVFHYIVTGTLFAVVCSVPWWPRIQWNCISPIFNVGPRQATNAPRYFH